MPKFSNLLPNIIVMVLYGSLEAGEYYLIRENENGSIEMVYVLMHSEKAVLIDYENEDKTKLWHLKSDTFFEVLEKLSGEAKATYELISNQTLPTLQDNEWDEDNLPQNPEEFWQDDDDIDIAHKN